MTPLQLVTAALAVLVVAAMSGVVVLQRGAPRRWGYAVLCACAIAAIWSWTDFGKFQTIWVDDASSASPSSAAAGPKKKVRQQRPFHFHEVVHYYLGAKYFRELGYLGLYDCVALADRQISDEDHSSPRISGYVRDLDDVLVDKPYERALEDCRTERKPRFSAARWASFVNDVRELARLIDDGAWPSVVFDAGFNPPPSAIVVTTTVTNLIPLRAGEASTYLVATTLDFVLLFASFFVLRSAFGRTTAVVAVVFFGATFIAHYSWNGGSVLRFTWVTLIVFALAALKRERWVLAGALFGAATCDRVFPMAFAAFAMVPVAMRAVASPPHRAIMRRFAVGFAATVAVLVLASFVAFDASAWRVFFSRITRHADVYYVMHIGLKKVLTFRDWVYAKNFHGHDGLARFRDWNLQLRATWASMRALTLPLQAVVVAATAWASMRRRPYEAALLGGIVFMFAFNLPANYYYCVLALAPALLLRAGATSRSALRRYRELAAFVAFSMFWMFSFLAPQLSRDGIVFNFYLSTALGIVIVLWIAAWAEPSALVDLAALPIFRGVFPRKGRPS